MHILPTYLLKRSDYLKYFENIAERREEINHMPSNKKQKRYFLDLTHVTGLNIKGMVMVALSLPMRHSGSLDNITQSKFFEIYILKAVGDELEIIDDTCDECESVADKIVSKLIKDSAVLISSDADDLFKQKEGIFFVPFPGYHLISKYNKKEVLNSIESAFIANFTPDKIRIKKTLE